MTRFRGLVVGVVGAGLLIGSMGAQGGCTSTGSAKAGTASTTGSDTTSSDNSGGDSSSQDSSFTPTPAMYRVRAKVLSKDCFGSAGCNVNVKILLSVVDPAAEGQPVELTVKITGDESGPNIQTIDVDADGNYDPPTAVISTASSAVVVRAKITEADKTS